MNSASNSILRRIRAKQRGWVFTPKDFIDIAPRNTIGIVLYRLLKNGTIRRLGHGLYDFPIKHTKLGLLTANPDSIAKAMAAKTGDTTQPSGASLANQLGLDTQVPSKSTYITSGNSIRKKIANYPISLHHSKFLNSATFDLNSARIINALHHLGKNNITDDTIKKCKSALTQRSKSQIKKNLAKLPNWMIPHILKIIGK